MDIVIIAARLSFALTAPVSLLVIVVLVFLSTLRQRMIVAVIGGVISGIIRHIRAQRVADDLGLRDPVLIESLLWPIASLLLVALLIHAIASARKRAFGPKTT